MSTARSASGAASDFRVRSDLSATLFLADPDSYDGGELVIEDSFGEQRVKLPAGHMVLYPASSVHRVEPVTRGIRVASFFWVQSMVRDDGARRILFELDQAVQDVAARLGPGRPGGGAADRHLSQPAAALGRGIRTTMTKIGMRNAWFQVHKWIGLSLAILIIPLCVTGAALVWDEALDHSLNPQRYAVSGRQHARPAALCRRRRRRRSGRATASSTLTLPDGDGPVIVAAIPAPRPSRKQGRRRAPTSISTRRPRGCSTRREQPLGR